MVLLYTVRFLVTVVHLYTSFSMDPLRGKFIPKISIFGHFWRRKPIFFKATTAKFSVMVRTYEFLPHAKFCKKNHLRGYTALEQIYTKHYQFWRFWG